MIRGCSGCTHLGSKAGGLSDLLQLSIVTVLRVQGDALLDRLQRRGGRAHLHLGRLHRQRLGLHILTADIDLY